MSMAIRWLWMAVRFGLVQCFELDFYSYNISCVSGVNSVQLKKKPGKCLELVLLKTI